MDPRKIKLMDQVNMIKDRKQKVYTFSLITFIVVIILIVGAIKPSIETIVRLNEEINQKQEVKEKLETKMNALNQLSIQYAEFEQTANDLELIFPTNGDFSLFLANIESLSEESGFELVNISFDTGSYINGELKTLDTLGISLSVVGPRDGMIPFLKKMESLPMYTEVKSISFSSEVVDGGTSFNISMVIYEVSEENFYD